MTMWRKITTTLATASLLALFLGLACSTAGDGGVRAAAAAGRFYPGAPATLRSTVDSLLEKAPAPGADGRPIALVAPHAGYVYSGATAAAAYKWLEGRSAERVVVLGISHYGGPEPVWVDDVGAYSVPGAGVPVDREAVAALSKAGLPAISGAADREHSIEVQLPFLLETLEPGWKLVPVLFTTDRPEECRRAARCIRTVLARETIVCVSTDFTHYGQAYGYTPFSGDDAEIKRRIRELDERAFEHILAGDGEGFAKFLSETGATICARGAVMALLELLPPEARGHKVAYATSGEMTGSFKMSVSYGALLFTLPDDSGQVWETQNPGENPMSAGSLTEQEKQTLLHIARGTLEAAAKDQRPPEFDDLEMTGTLKEKRGAFVTLKKDGRLRGCIGYVEPIKPLWVAVRENTVNAAARDPRFSPVTPAEVDSISIEISAMSPLQEVSDPETIEVGKHGIIISRGPARGLLLPQVATEQGWDREEFLCHTCRKAGLPQNAWREEGTEIEVFTAEVFGEEEGGEG